MKKMKFIAVLMLSLVSFTAVSQAQDPASPASDSACNSLSADEQQFASQLSPENMAVFCKQLTPAQRMSAMQMVKTPDASGNVLTPDQAVQSVMAPAAPSSAKSGGCGVQ